MRTRTIQDGFGTVLTAGNGERIGDVPAETVIAAIKATGLVLFEGFRATRDEFDDMTDRVGGDYMNYKGGGYIRKTDGEDKGKTILSTSTTVSKGKIVPFTAPLPLHLEMSYTDKQPLLLWFYCVTPPAKDGQTTVGDGWQVYDRLPQKWKDLLAEKRLMYLRAYPEGVWQNIYMTDDIDEARAFCHDSGMTTEVDADGTLHTKYLRTATPKTRWGGRTAYANSAMTVVMQEGTDREKLSSIRLEDGEKLPREMIQDIVRIQSEIIVDLEWESGDFVLLDNTRTMHGRRGFEDTNREVLLRMIEDAPF